MILHCNYEEIRALEGGARSILGEIPGEGCVVAAPPEGRARVEAFMPRLRSEMYITTLSEQRQVRAAVEVIVQCLRAEMDAMVVAHHPADESAVAAYFEFAHCLSVLGRIRQLGSEMEAVIELVTGEPVDAEMADAFVFPD